MLFFSLAYYCWNNFYKFIDDTFGMTFAQYYETYPPP